MSVWWRHNLSLERKSQTSGFCVRLRASEPINALLQTVELYCGCLGHFVGISVPGKGGIPLRLRGRVVKGVGHLDHVRSYGVREVVSSIPDRGNIVG